MKKVIGVAPRVLTYGTVVAHYPDATLWHCDVELLETVGGCVIWRPGNVRLSKWYAVDGDLPRAGAALDPVPGDADHPFHEVLPRVCREQPDEGQTMSNPALWRRGHIEGGREPTTRVLENHDLPTVNPVDLGRELADQDTVVDLQRRNHRLRRDVERLDHEGPDQN